MNYVYPTQAEGVVLSSPNEATWITGELTKHKLEYLFCFREQLPITTK